ncbi:MAG: cytochrome c [Magnetococcales bacterium]|nr:cytochrome c [Magnetococcales bacterium]
MISNKVVSLGAVFAMMIMAAGLAQASSHGGNHNKADALVMEREALMEGIGGSMGALACYLKEECKLEPKIAKRLAVGISAMAKPSIEAFRTPTPTASKKTTAIAKIWTDWDQFEEGLMSMSTKAQGLAEAIKNGKMGDIKAAMGELGKNCKGCHDNFREKK